jgi:2-iminobutanoate/2-iminopropanoate deaminase
MSIPAFAKRGPLLAASTIRGGSGDAETQMNKAFANLGALLRDAGIGQQDVASVVVNIADHAQRPHINPPWLELFPHEHSRPARRTTKCRLPEGELVQLQVLALPGQRREALEIPGQGHRDPLPMGVRMGGMVFSSALNGPAETAAEQIDLTFQNAGRLMDIAGGALGDVAHMWVFMRDRADQPALIDTWLRTFPTDGDRPARKTIIPYELAGTQQIQAQLTAVLGAKRANYEIPGVGHHDPIPMACRAGQLLFSSGIPGVEPGHGTEVAGGFERQLELAFANLRTLLAQAGTSLNDVAQLIVMLQDFGDEPAFRAAYDEAFGQAGPAVHVTTLGIASQAMRIQLHAVAGFA